MRKTITVLTISIMLATNSMAGLFTPDSVAKIEKTTDNAIAILNDTTAIAGNDTKSFDMPEYMYQEIDSMLNCWQARNLLNKLNTPVDTTENIKISDTIYAERLQSMPTIVKMPYNRVVRSCIDSYTTKNRSLVAYMLGISEFYMPIIEEEIDRAGIPHELKYLPIIESALNPKAVSRVNAKGLWQFIFSTAKTYGLKSNNYIDERFDPIKSTKAAIRYLADLYKLFGKWELAIAAYNCGPGNVKKAIVRSGGKTDFWDIYYFLPRETRGYLPMFIAANYIMTFHKEHGIQPLEPKTTITTDTVLISKNLHFKQISEVCGADIEEIRALNPQYIKDIIPGENEPYVLRLSNNLVTDFLANEDSIYKHKEKEFFPRESIASMLKQAKENNGGIGTLKRHKIKSGETLGSIALKYRVTVKQIMRWNGLKNSNIRAGKYLNIY
ncbi:MAG: transglycosylase SLT domain-containing protein [Bacteroidaceae bacterium]|nr:transglycosylase SLT domain-containing protein [Bacteroidaceae bacterium]